MQSSLYESFRFRYCSCNSELALMIVFSGLLSLFTFIMVFVSAFFHEAIGIPLYYKVVSKNVFNNNKGIYLLTGQNNTTDRLTIDVF